MSETGEALGRAWRRTEAVVPTRTAAAALFALAVAVYWVEALAWPLDRGRDTWDYLAYYLGMWDGDPPFRAMMAFKTPVAPLVLGVSLQLGGTLLLEIVMSALYAVSIVAWSAVALAFGRLPALLTAVVLLAYPPYGSLFHDATSDAVFAAGFALWSLGIVRTARSPALWKFAALGAGVVVLVLTRPANQALLAFAVFPLVLPGPFRSRLAWSAAFLGTAAALLGAWAGHNAVRYDDFTISRVRVAWVPFFGALFRNRIQADNGPASRELARAVERDILSRPPYRAAGVDLETYFSISTSYEFIDLLALSDRVWGWESDYRILRRAAREGGRGGGLAYWPLTKATSRGIWWFLRRRPIREPGAVRGPETAVPPRTIFVGGHVVPNPAAIGTPPEAAEYGFMGCPSSSLPRCTIADPARVWSDPADRRAYTSLVSRLGEWSSDLPSRNGSAWLADQLKRVTWHFPRPWLWLAVGLAGLALRRPRGMRVLLALCLLAGLVLAVHGASRVLVTEYAIPVFPAFLVFAIVGLTGERGHREREGAP